MKDLIVLGLTLYATGYATGYAERNGDRRWVSVFAAFGIVAVAGACYVYGGL